MPFLIRLLSLLPLQLLHNLGALLGWLAFACSPTYRRHLNNNLALAGDWAKKHRAIAIMEAGKTIFELPKIWLRPRDEVVARVVRVTGWELVEAAWRERNQGILFLTPHLGCFEITAQYYASYRPISVLYRPPKQAWLRPLMERGRGATLKLASADLSGVRTLLKALKRGEAIGMLPDQVPGKGEGVWAPFFNRPAYTMTLAARLAADDATVLLAYAERLVYGAGYHLKLRPLTVSLTGTLEERVVQLNHELEGLIRECPGQYLWGYNRYKVPRGAVPPEGSA
ncbi:MAG: lysophospholipid acyltransferase family protein [Sterolibacterium sp.]|nr:lysophospholipid acyltransferase family protein [Sterolibacterium sp.]